MTGMYVLSHSLRISHALIDSKMNKQNDNVSFFICSHPNIYSLFFCHPFHLYFCQRAHIHTFSCLSFFNSIQNDNCLKYLTRKILFIRSSNHEIIKQNKKQTNKKNQINEIRNGKCNNAVIISNSVVKNGTEKRRRTKHTRIVRYMCCFCCLCCVFLSFILLALCTILCACIVSILLCCCHSRREKCIFVYFYLQ